MFETKYSKFLTALLIIIIVAVIGLLGFLGYNYYKNYSVNNDSDKFVSTFVQESEENKKDKDNNTDSSTNTDLSNLEGEVKQQENTEQNQAKKPTYKGFNVVGTIEIPKTNVKYPVLEDPPTVKKLDTAVATVFPQHAELNVVGNAVIVGHNYRNGLFFSNNKKLSNGDKIYITGLDGNKVTYTIYNVFQASQDDTSFYNRDTNGKMEITLSTCTDASNDQRIIVEARAD